MNSEHPVASGSSADLVALTVDLLAAYVSNNTVPFADLPGLVAAVHGAMSQLGQPQPAPAETYAPAVSVKKSVTPDALISLIDGKPYKTLKRHLTGHGLTPAEYRQRYGLPADYPMSAANYSAQRSEMAKRIGLGGGRKSTAVPVAEAPSEPATDARGTAPRRRGKAKDTASAIAAEPTAATPKRRRRKAGA
jgi:predicted transcriptional regulator